MDDFGPEPDADEIRRVWRVFAEPGDVIEMRVLHAGRAGTVCGYFNEIAPFVEAALRWNARAPAVYFLPNPVVPDLLARAANRAKERATETTTDGDVAACRWLLVDFDAIRPKGISATDEQHDAAIARAWDCREWLRKKGWPLPVVGDSGNGAHLCYRIEQPNNIEARSVREGCLKALALQFSDEVVKVDQATFNAARIWKLYGTAACKGDNVPERPHRLSRLLEVPNA